MKREFDGFEHPNHTQVPNDFFDRLLPRIEKECELRVTLVAVRRTLGYHTDEAELSLSFLMEGTGMSRKAVREGLAAAIRRGTMTLAKKQTNRDGAVYGLRWSKIQRVSKDTPGGIQKVRLEVSKRYPIKKVLKESKEIGDSKTESPAPLKEAYQQTEPHHIVKDIEGEVLANAEFDALPNASHGEPPRAQSAGVATPVEDWREFRRTYLDRVAFVLGHNSPSSGDKAALKRIWQMGAANKWESFLSHIENGGGTEFQKQGANAYWIAGKFDDYRVSGTMQVDRASQNTADALAAMRER